MTLIEQDISQPGEVSYETSQTPASRRKALHLISKLVYRWYFQPVLKTIIQTAGRSPQGLRSAESVVLVEELRRRVIKAQSLGAKPLARTMMEKAGDCPVDATWMTSQSETNASDCVILYVHGGSFIHQRSIAQTRMTDDISQRTGARVLLVDYRLAPENPYPAAMEDVKAAYLWLIETGVNPEQIVFLGESTGGGILLSSLLSLRDDGAALPAAVVALSPWADLTLTGWTMASESFLSGLHIMETCSISAYAYLQGANPWDPGASAVFGDFRDMPPILLHVSEDEPYYDDARRIAERIRDARGDLTMRIWPAEDHTWQLYGGPAADCSLEDAANFITRKVLDPAQRVM